MENILKLGFEIFCWGFVGGAVGAFGVFFPGFTIGQIVWKIRKYPKENPMNVIPWVSIVSTPTCAAISAVSSLILNCKEFKMNEFSRIATKIMRMVSVFRVLVLMTRAD